MSEQFDAETEALLRELAKTDDERDLLLEEHRQLEKDLLRLADPLPPPDFLAKVMTRVAAAPARPVSRADVWSAVAIVGVKLAGASTSPVSSHATSVWASAGPGLCCVSPSRSEQRDFDTVRTCDRSSDP